MAPRLRGVVLLLAAALSLGQVRPEVQPPDPLVRARQHYNDRRFDAAIEAADEARKVPALANPALVVAARARLERYRDTGQPEDLADAREALKLVYATSLTPREHVEFLIGLGESLYFDGCVDGCLSAAAEMFEDALGRAAAVDASERDAIFEWWAASLDRAAQFGLESERARIYARILQRAEVELGRAEGSAPASYWLAAAARGVRDYERAWGAAIAGWVRARYMGPRGAELREDLDEFVTRVLLPERARQQTPDGDPRPTYDRMLEHWEDIKRKWRG